MALYGIRLFARFIMLRTFSSAQSFREELLSEEMSVMTFVDFNNLRGLRGKPFEL